MAQLQTTVLADMMLDYYDRLCVKPNACIHPIRLVCFSEGGEVIKVRYRRFLSSPAASYLYTGITRVTMAHNKMSSSARAGPDRVGLVHSRGAPRACRRYDHHRTTNSSCRRVVVTCDSVEAAHVRPSIYIILCPSRNDSHTKSLCLRRCVVGVLSLFCFAACCCCCRARERGTTIRCV